MHRHRRRNIRNRPRHSSLYIHSLRSLLCRDRSRQWRKDRRSLYRRNRHTHRHRCRDRHSPHPRDNNRHTRSSRNRPESGRSRNSRHSRRQDRRYSRTRNTCSGQADSSLPSLNTRRSLKCRTGRKKQQQPYLSDQEYPAYSEKDYEEYVDFPQSMLEPKYSSYQTV